MLTCRTSQRLAGGGTYAGATLAASAPAIVEGAPAREPCPAAAALANKDAWFAC